MLAAIFRREPPYRALESGAARPAHNPRSWKAISVRLL